MRLMFGSQPVCHAWLDQRAVGAPSLIPIVEMSRHKRAKDGTGSHASSRHQKCEMGARCTSMPGFVRLVALSGRRLRFPSVARS